MQERYESWSEVLENYAEALKRIRELEEENEDLKCQLALQKAFNNCDKQSVVQ